MHDFKVSSNFTSIQFVHPKFENDYVSTKLQKNVLAYFHLNGILKITGCFLDILNIYAVDWMICSHKV